MDGLVICYIKACGGVDKSFSWQVGQFGPGGIYREVMCFNAHIIHSIQIEIFENQPIRLCRTNTIILNNTSFAKWKSVN